MPTTLSRPIIRPATRTDLPSLGRLGALLVRTHHAFDADRFIAATPETEGGYAAFLGTQLDEPDALLLVAEQGGDVIGYTYATLEGHDWMTLRGPAGMLHDIVVDPAYRAAVGVVSRGTQCRRTAALRPRGVPADDDRDDARARRRALVNARRSRRRQGPQSIRFIRKSMPRVCPPCGPSIRASSESAPSRR